jgi:hypothetical protein
MSKLISGRGQCGHACRFLTATGLAVAGTIHAVNASTVNFYDVQILTVTPPDITATSPQPGNDERFGDYGDWQIFLVRARRPWPSRRVE